MTTTTIEPVSRVGSGGDTAPAGRPGARRLGVIGLLRDVSGGYTLPFYGCIALELIAAVLIMIRGRPRHSGLVR